MSEDNNRERNPAPLKENQVSGVSEVSAATGWDSLPEVLTVQEAARLLRMKPATLYESIKAGLIHAARPSPRCIRLSKATLRHWLEGKRSA